MEDSELVLVTLKDQESTEEEEAPACTEPLPAPLPASELRKRWWATRFFYRRRAVVASGCGGGGEGGEEEADDADSGSMPIPTASDDADSD